MEGDGSLVGFLSVLRVEFFGDVHALDDLANRRKALAVEESVVSKVDEHLRGASVASGGGEDQGSARIGDRDRIVGNVGSFVFEVELRIAREAELYDEARNDAEEASLVVEADSDELEETIHAERGPVRSQLDDDVAFCCF